MTGTIVEPPPLPARRFRLNRTSIERNRRWIDLGSWRAPILLFASCAVSILLIMSVPSSFPYWFDIGFALMFNFIFTSILFTHACGQFERMTYAVDSGILTFYRGERRDWHRMDLSKVSKVVIGDVARPETMRMQLITRWGWQIVVPALEDMEQFVAAIAVHVPVEIERRNEPLSPWTWQAFVPLAIVLGIVAGLVWINSSL